MYNVLFTIGSEIVHAEQYAEIHLAKVMAARLEKQFGAHVITLGASNEKFAMAELAMAQRTIEDDERLMTREKMGTEPVECSRCNGTGTYHWGWNGQQFTKEGLCFDCKGKGMMDAADVKRDVYYHDHTSSLTA